MFKLPSVQHVFKEAGNTFKRFPLPLLVSIAATFIAVYLTHVRYEDRESTENLWKIVICCSLGLNLFIATRLFSESKGFSSLKYNLLQSVALLLLIGYYFTLPVFKDFTTQDIIRYALFSIGLHLLVSFAPFISKGHTNGFWQFNKSLFLRFLTACLYTGVLYIGLALALLAIDELFKVHVRDTYYLYLWWFLVGIFNTWFFLAGIPRQIQTLDTITSYPIGLKIFTQFVLLPLVAVYLLILYAYGTKIAIAMELPKGWVSYLVIGFSVVGILSLLLIWPVRENEGNRWIKIVNRWFYITLFPLIGLLALAIFKRLSQYGITENRYFILLIALWLTAMAIYFLTNKTKNIKVIPVSLCIIAFLSSFGPWSAFSISERSQIKRLEKILTKENILVSGKIKKSAPMFQGNNAATITSIIDYLEKMHGFKAIQPWFTQNLDSLFTPTDSNKYVDKRQIVMDLMGVDNYYYYYHSSEGQANFYIYSENSSNTVINVKGFDYYTTINEYSSDNDSIADYYPSIVFETDTLFIKYKNGKLLFYENKIPLKSIDFNGYIKTLKQNNKNNHGEFGMTSQQLLLPVETDSLSIQLNFTNISGTIDDNDSIHVNAINAHVLIKCK